jgi:hypothetical protein
MPNTDLAPAQQAVATRNVVTMPIAAATMEKVLIQGDLSKLDAQERLNYYGSLCQSIGLNPLTKPFEYLTLKGKTILYALRSCTEQLRQLHNVSITITARESVDGCYVVTARATLPNNRQDESIGAVGIEGLKGEDRSNAMMKAETKAKRRVTLSICGLAFLDESEAESVRGAQHVPVNMETGEMPEPAQAPTLHEDIAANPPKAKSTTPFNALQAFGELKKRFAAMDPKHTAYYMILAKWGVKKSNEFPAGEEGIKRARGCYKELSLYVQEMETAAKVEVKPDPVELPQGRLVVWQGLLWQVEHGDQSSTWVQVK